MKFLLSYDTSVDGIALSKDYFKEISNRLSETKALIDDCPDKWEICKKIIHVHEYVYSSSHQRRNLCHIVPVSRSYFKMKELKQEYLGQIQSCVCLAEAPGGFIQCLLETDIPKIYGVTLVSDDKKVPFWNRLLTTNDRFVDYRGIKGSGDLVDFTNVLSLIKRFGRQAVDLVTGDGGFDTSSDYNHQELNSLSLIYSEIYIALHIQKIGGSFMCKVFDTFVRETVLLIYSLTLCYDEVYLHKPSISRLSNSEKYVVCRGFKGASMDLLNHMTHHFTDNQLDMSVNASFLQKISEFNESYATDQCRSIQNGLKLIRTHKLIHRPTRHQLDEGISWCTKYDIPLNHQCQYL